MLIDLDDPACPETLTCDLCIVGAGAAGISLAREFLGARHAVVLLEAGGERIEPENADLFRGHVVGLPHLGIHQGRTRALGGTTHLWAGQALPLFPIDFEQRDWVPFSGWPLERETLRPFYRRAEAVMQVPHAGNGPEDWPSPDLPPFDPDLLSPIFSQFAAEPNFARKYGRDLARSANVTVVTHANVTSLEASEGADAIRQVRAASRTGREIRVRPRIVVLCAGGIETPRLMLLSDGVEPHGVGNRHDRVGRFFQDHPVINRVAVRPKRADLFARWCNSFRRNGIRYTLKVAPSERLMRSARILHAGAEVYYPPGPDDALEAAKRILRAVRDRGLPPDLPRLVGRMARDPGKVLSAAYHHYLRGQPASVGRTEPKISFYAEQEPNPDSRVTLAPDRDGLGLRRAILDWRLGTAEAASIAALAEVLEREWARLGLAEIDLEPVRRAAGDHSVFEDNNHHIGTCRMGTDPRTSVVDPDCRVHGYGNLYVGGSATFPTGGFSNPTLTIIALCLRIADEVQGRLDGDRGVG